MKATILCYHKVGPGSQEGRSLNVEPRRLASHIRFYSRRGTAFLLAKQLSEPFESGSVCFTFDDAYSSAIANAALLFKRYGQLATFYAVSELVGHSSSWDGELARPLATLDELREAQAQGHEIGNHTARHLRLGELSAEQQEAQIVGAHESLGDAGLTLSSVCYPYGSYNGDTLEIAKRLGYRVGLSLRKGLMSPESPKLELPRVVVAYSDTLPMLIYKTTIRQWLRTKPNPSLSPST